MLYYNKIGRTQISAGGRHGFKEAMKSSGLSQEDAQVQNNWRKKRNGAMG